MKRKKEVFLSAVLVFMAAFSFFLITKGTAQKGVEAAAIGTVQVPGMLNVRSGPGTTYELVRSGGTGVTLTDGAKVTITGVNGKWYHVKFTQNSKKIEGYVSSDYVKVRTGSVRTKVYGIVNASSVKVLSKAATGAEAVKAGKKEISLKKQKKVRILSESVVKDEKWCKISFSESSKTYKGYVLEKYITITCDKGLPGVVKASSAVSLYQTAGKNTVVQANGKKVSVKNGKQMTILSQKTISDKTYLYVKMTYNNAVVKGYLPEQYGFLQIVTEEKVAASPTADVKKTPLPSASADTSASPKVTTTPKPSATPKPTAAPVTMSDGEYKKKLENDGFPQSYTASLLALHKKYPNWIFTPYKTGLKWSTVISKESKVGLNLIPNSKSPAWKSTEEGAYDWKKDKYIPFDGSTWVTASKKAVKYYMDPRNFLDERGIFQFENLAYQEDDHNQSGVENILNNTPMHDSTFTYKDDSSNSKTVKYSDAFMAAASESGVSPYHLASRVKQEVVVSPTLMSSSVSGKVAGYEGIYNFYNIGAYHSTASGGAIANGLSWASTGTTYLRPWNSPYKSIVGGASYIGKNYINVGQNTLYLQKFNVTGKNRYSHQYMANVEAPNSEATKTSSAYGAEKDDMTIVFSIPVYNNMPETPCSVPSGGKNPNNYLKSLSVADHAFSSKFVLGDDGSKTYTLTVANNVTSVKINAKAVSSKAAVTGTGTKQLGVGTKTYTVKVTSESGAERKYNIKITRKSA
ncbi:MAG: SH3 domain-containing protein [Lachnospiraceae bacterium]|nr:SH3 domain-containing protein [Lachnospiraceae bacterium]